MAVKQGTVATVEVLGPFQGPKSDYFRQNVTVDGEMYSMFSSTNAPAASAGDIVEFTYEINSKSGKQYRNINGKSFSVTGKGVAPAASVASGRASSMGITDRNLEIKAGRAVNNAVSLFQMGQAESLEAALKEAVELEVYVDRAYSRMYAAASKRLDDKIAERRTVASPPPPPPAAPAEPDVGDDDNLY